MPLPHAAVAPAISWQLDGQTLSLDDYLARQPVMALLIAKDGVVQLERYQFARGPRDHYLSNSIAKSIASLAVGFAQAEGRITSFDTLLQTHVPALTGTAYGETRLRNLMRMASGVRFKETYEPDDDLPKLGEAVRARGIVEGARLFNDREAPQGTRFHYASIETSLLGAALKAATGKGLADYLTPRLWQAIGAEADAYWWADRTGLEFAQCCFTAIPHDYLRLGIVLANDGARPDTGRQVIPRDYLREATDWRRADAPFRPAPNRYGYGYKFWLEGGEGRRFMLLGVYGQAIFVDPDRKLVMVHFAANRTATASGTTMARERIALWRGVVRHFAGR